MDIIYRTAESSDLDNILDLYRQATKVMNDSGLYQWDEQYPTAEEISADIENKELYVGLTDGEIVLAYTINRDYDEEFSAGKWEYPDDSFYIIHRLCVSPKYRKQGLAKAAMEHIESELAKIGAESVRLDTFEENTAAFSLYKKLGYKTVGIVEFRTGQSHLMEKKLSAKRLR